METSKSLLDRLRLCPDEQSWGQLNALYRPWLLRWLRRDPSLGEDAEDLAQEILIFVSQELGGFQHRGSGSFRKWLRAIAGRRLLGYYRTRRNRRALGGNDSDEPLAQLADDGSDLAKLWDQEHHDYVVRRLLELLDTEFSETYRRAFQRVVLDGVKPALVAEELGVPVNVVCQAKSRVLKHLRVAGEGLFD